VRCLYTVAAVPTPVIVFRYPQLDTRASACRWLPGLEFITRSNYNGLKIMLMVVKPCHGDAIKALHRRILNGNLASGFRQPVVGRRRRCLSWMTMSGDIRPLPRAESGVTAVTHAGELGPMLIDELGCDVCSAV